VHNIAISPLLYVDTGYTVWIKKFIPWGCLQNFPTAENF